MLTVENTETQVVSLLAEAGGPISFISSDEVHYTWKLRLPKIHSILNYDYLKVRSGIWNDSTCTWDSLALCLNMLLKLTLNTETHNIIRVKSAVGNTFLDYRT